MYEEMQHIDIELLGILQKREMAHLRFNEESAVGDVISHKEGVLALDRLIMIRIHDPRRHFDAGEIVIGPVGLRLPHPGDRGEK